MTGGTVKCIAWSNNGLLAVRSCDDNIYVFDTYGNLKWKYGAGGIIERVAWSNNGLLAVGSTDNCVYIFDCCGGWLMCFVSRYFWFIVGFSLFVYAISWVLHRSLFLVSGFEVSGGEFFAGDIVEISIKLRCAKRVRGVVYVCFVHSNDRRYCTSGKQFRAGECEATIDFRWVIPSDALSGLYDAVVVLERDGARFSSKAIRNVFRIVNAAEAIERMVDELYGDYVGFRDVFLSYASYNALSSMDLDDLKCIEEAGVLLLEVSKGIKELKNYIDRIKSNPSKSREILNKAKELYNRLKTMLNEITRFLQ